MGKLIVFEGTDGSGKATQTKLLCMRLEKEGVDYRKLDFPRYDNDSSTLLRMYLHGAFGERPDDVNAYAASTFFAVDRYASFKQDWGTYYENGGLIITDRYTTSNAVHQAVKLPEDERDDYINWLFDYEYRLLGIPEPDLVIYLDMPTGITEKMIKNRGSAEDIHEKDTGYLERCRQSALQTALRYGWRTVRCAAGDRPRPPEDIGGEIYDIVKAALLEE